METSTTLMQYRLREKIKALEAEKELHEKRISGRLDELQRAIEHPAPYIKTILLELAADQKVQKDLLKTGAHFTTDYLIDKYLPKDRMSFVQGLLGNLQKKAGGGVSGMLLDAVAGLFFKKR